MSELQPRPVQLESMVSSQPSVLMDAYDAVFLSIDPIARAAANAIHDVTSSDPQADLNPWLTTPFDGEGRCALRNATGQQLVTEPKN